MSSVAQGNSKSGLQLQLLPEQWCLVPSRLRRWCLVLGENGILQFHSRAPTNIQKDLTL